MLFNLEKHLVVLATDTPSRRELLNRLVPEIHFKLGEHRVPFVRGKDIVTPYLKNSVDRTIAWCGDYLPRDYSDKFERMTIIAASSIVVVGDEVLTKTPSDVLSQLRLLAGSSHRILTALRVVSLAPDLHFYWERAEVIETEVQIDAMTSDDIQNYAGSIEAKSLSADAAWFRPDSRFVQGIVGSDSNVLGLPLCALGKIFQELGNT
jgi:predicted house-cleaning NTP pyrophosphatase (Maf/HAM1 superfamily)